MKKPPQNYTDLKELSTEMHTYNSILTLLHWDQETYMPPGGNAPRSHQVALLSTLIHERKTSRKFKECLNKLVRTKGLSKEQQAAVREWALDFKKATKLPASFVKTFSQLKSEAGQVWASAKKENNFKVFAPFLGKIIDMCKEKAHILGFDDHPYDALLEGYEPCMTTKRVGHIFEGLQKELKKLLSKIDGCKQVDDRFLHGKVGDHVQMELGRHFVGKLPMDGDYTRLDLSNHPFSLALHPHDSRITTRLLPKGFMSNVFSVLHEAGHSMYEMGLPTEHWGTPLCEATSLSIHESQSRWWETLIGRSIHFWKHFYPDLQKKIPALKKVSLDKFYKGINKVEPSFIRVEADEVTYGLHVILRFEIEKALISGDLQVADLPEAWNAKMKELFGITPPNDSQGCLQDIHWSLGDFGYFPTYALGNLFSAHFFTAFAKEHRDWEGRVARGDLGFIREWLRKNIHCHGRMYNADELAKRVVGKPLDESAYCNYLKKKYAAIYQF